MRSIWEAAQRGEYEIWTSTYAYLELQYGITPRGEAYNAEESDAKFEALLSQDYVKRVQLDTRVGRYARKLKRDLHAQGLDKRSDAIHLATALIFNCEELHTWDGKHLLPFDGKIACSNGRKLKIVKPGNDYTDFPLFGLLTVDEQPKKEAATDLKRTPMGRITTMTLDNSPREITSYDTPGGKVDIMKMAAHWALRARSERRQEQYLIDVPGYGIRLCSGVEVLAGFEHSSNAGSKGPLE